MNAHYSKHLSHAFVVGPDELKKFVGLLQERIGKVDICAYCADGFSREFKAVKDLIAYENPKSKDIRRIHLSAHSDDYKKSALDYETYRTHRTRFAPSLLHWHISYSRVHSNEANFDRLGEQPLANLCFRGRTYGFVHFRSPIGS